MSEPMYVVFSIGGEVTEEILEGLINHLDNSISELDGPTNVQELRQYSGNGNPHWCGESHYGNLDDVKAFCAKHKIPYIHNVEGKYEYNAVNYFWSPDMEDESFNEANNDGVDVVASSDIWPLVDILKARAANELPLLIAKLTGEKDAAVLRACLAHPEQTLEHVIKAFEERMPTRFELPPLVIKEAV